MIHLIVGNTGSGKTTYATELKLKTTGIIFSIDTWNNTLFLPDKKPADGLEWFLERFDRAEKVMMDLVQQLEIAKTDSILDLGLSKFSHRENSENSQLRTVMKSKHTSWTFQKKPGGRGL